MRALSLSLISRSRVDLEAVARFKFRKLKFRYAPAIFTSAAIRVIDKYFARPSGQIARRGKDALSAAGSLVFAIFQSEGREREREGVKREK